MTSRDFSERWLLHSEAAYRVALYILEDPKDAEDAVQDVFLKLWSSQIDPDELSNPRAYVLRAVRNLCVDRVRAASRYPQEPLTDSTPLYSPGEQDVSERDRLRKVLDSIERLPDRQRTCIKLKVLEGMDYEQIAQRTGLKEGNVRVQISLARKKLKKIYEKV